MNKTVLITGSSGRCGSHAAKAFANAGWQVKRFDRRQNLTEAARGADVIFNGMNPPNYNNWRKNIPEITNRVIAAAKANGATILMPGTVYVYGDTPGDWSENTLQRPCSRKGRIRVEMEQTFKRAAAEGVQTILLRGGDFIDPDNGTDVFEYAYYRDLAKGKITYLGDPDKLRAHCYLPDFARAFVMLAENRDKLSAYEDIPFPGHSFSINQLRQMTQDMCGRDLKLSAFPWWALRLMSPFSELFREMLEMRYLWNTEHQLDSKTLKTLLPEFQETKFKDILAACMRRESPETLNSVHIRAA